MKKNSRTWIAVIAPLALGVVLALVFLANYLNKNRAIVTIRNRSGYALSGGQLRISSQPKEQEVGGIQDGDSAQVVFEKFGAAHYEFTGQFSDGKTMRDSGGALAAGKSYQDEILIVARHDSLVAEFRQAASK